MTKTLVSDIVPESVSDNIKQYSETRGVQKKNHLSIIQELMN